jgi:DNA-binding beta-propeller fold protein YncE
LVAGPSAAAARVRTNNSAAFEPAALIAPGAARQTGASGYRLAKKYKLGGEGGWDYLLIDSPKHRLFISRGTRVMVVDTNDGKVIGEVPGLHRSHGIALAPEFNKGFASDGEPGSVVIFDYQTLKVLDTVKTDADCDGIIYDPATKRVFTMNGDPGTSTAIDANSGKVISTFQLGGKPEFAATDGKGHVFANIEDKSEMVKIDANSLKVEQTWPLDPCKSPSGLAIDAEHERLFPGCHNGLMAFVDGDSGKVLDTVPIGQGVDANRFDPGTGYAFASCGDGTITVAHEDSPDKLTVVDKIPTQRGARTMEVDLKTHTLYTVTAEFGPPPPATAEHPRPRPTMIPDTFTLLVFTR